MKPARLYPSSIRIALPAVQQHTGFTCGPAALHSILAYYGVASADHSSTARLCKPDPTDGTNPRTIARVARRHGLNVKIVEGFSDDDLRKTLDIHRPVILNIRAYGDGHYVAACGYDSKYVVVMEPMSDGHWGYLTWKELAGRWWDIDNEKRNDRLGIIIYGKQQFWQRAVWVKP